MRQVIEKIKELIDDLVVRFKGTEQEKQLREVQKKFIELYNSTEADIVNEVTEGTKYSLIGTNKDGIEVYETSQDTMDLTWVERKAKYLDILQDEYRDRTARFKRNGHTYFAKFDLSSLRKHIYGDKRSSKNGVRALIKAGADGDIFDLIENSQFDFSKPNKKNNTNADYFDYFVKTVQIDGKVFDLVADIEKDYGVKDGYVYTLALRDNKTIKASPAIGTSQSEPLQNAGNTLNENILPQNSEKSSEIDNQYLDAVNRGDTETAQSNDDIRYSLAKQGESDYNKSLQSIRYKGDIAPIRDDIWEKTKNVYPDDYAPTREDLQPVTEDEANAMLQEQNDVAPLTDADVPPEGVTPIYDGSDTKIDEHLRTMIRVMIWKQWKVPKKRLWGLLKLGVPK